MFCLCLYFNKTNKGFALHTYKNLLFNVITPHLGLFVEQDQLRLNIVL